MRILYLLLAVGADLILGGCLQSTTIVKINGDGSGTIEQNMALSSAAVAQLRQLAALRTNTNEPLDPFSDDQLRNMAASFGPNVTIVSSTPIKTESAEGKAVIFAFQDINQLRIDAQPLPSGGLNIHPPDVGTTEGNAARFTMARQPNGTALVRITMPPLKMPTPPLSSATGGGTAEKRITPEQLAMMKQMFAGMRMVIAVVPAGRLVSTNSPCVDGQTVTLLDLDFDQLIKDDAALARLQAAHSAEDPRTVLKDFPGLKVCLDPEIRIEFVPAK